MAAMHSEGTPRWSVSTSAGSFERDVIARSQEVLVVVDFWAPWCGPCRALGPVLEKLAEAYAGAFVLVKANTDEMPDIAASFNVSGIPAVFAVYSGQVLDFFTGALPESHVRQWLDRAIAASGLQSLRALEQHAPAEAEGRYRQILAGDPANADAHLGLARTLVALERFDDARPLIKQLEDHGLLDVEGQRIKAILELHAKPAHDLPRLRAAAEAQPDDLPLQLQLAEALAGSQQYEAALELLLALFQRDKKGVGPRAKELMVQIFHALPDDSELSATYRRKLSMAMY
jgi:putative thioredoxin